MRRQILKSDSTFILIGGNPAWTTGAEFTSLISLVQSSNVSVSSDRQSLKQVGSQNFIVNDVMRSPDVSLNIDYYLEPGMYNESLIGLSLGYGGEYVPALSGSGSLLDKNFYFIIDTEAGRDAFTLFKQGGITNFSGFNAFSVGNCYLTSYSVGFSLGQVPVASTSFLGSNMRMENITGTKISIPAINSISGNNLNSGFLDLSNVHETISGIITSEGRSAFNPLVTSPNESIFSLENLQVGGIKLSDVDAPILQSLNLNLNLERTPLYGLGSNYVYNRKLQLPAVGNVEIGCIVSGVATGSLSSLFTNETGYTIEIKHSDFKSNTTGFYKIIDAKLDSYSLSMPVNNQMEFSANFSFQATLETGFLMTTNFS